MELPDIARLEALRSKGDPAADAVVAEMATSHSALVLGALLDMLFQWDPAFAFPTDAKGVPAGAIDAANRFIHATDPFGDAIPGEAVDWARVTRAQAFFKRYQFSGLMVLGCASLPACYAHPSVALVLMGSGRLAVQVRRRLVETITFLTNVMDPGWLNSGKAVGALWVCKVRLMHALMRRLTLEDAQPFKNLPDDRPSNFLLKLDWSRGDTPINQVELAYVLQTFSWLLVDGFRHLRVRMSQAQRDDHVYTWAVIGHGLGIDAALRPRDAREAEVLFARIRDRFGAGTEEGRLLTAALIVYVVIRQREAIVEFLPILNRPALRPLVRLVRPFAEACLESLARTLVRELAGAATAEKLWVPRAPFVHWVVGKLLRVLMTGLELRSGHAETGLPRIVGRRLRPAS